MPCYDVDDYDTGTEAVGEAAEAAMVPNKVMSNLMLLLLLVLCDQWSVQDFMN